MTQGNSVKMVKQGWADEIIARANKQSDEAFLEKERKVYREELNKIKEDKFNSITMDDVKKKLQGEHTGILQW